MIRKSFHIEEDLLEKVQKHSKQLGIKPNTFIRLAVEEKVHSDNGRMEQALKSLETMIENLRKQTIDTQVGITEETLNLSKSIRKANEESIDRQEHMVKGIILKLVNLQTQESEAAPSQTPPSQPKQPARKSGPDFKVD